MAQDPKNKNRPGRAEDPLAQAADEFSQAIQQAVSSEDFARLRDAVGATVDAAKQMARTTGSQVGEAVGKAAQSMAASAQANSQGPASPAATRKPGAPAKPEATIKSGSPQPPKRKASRPGAGRGTLTAAQERKLLSRRYKNGVGLSASGYTMEILGGFFSFGMLLSCITALVEVEYLGAAGIASLVLFLVLFILCLRVTVAGYRRVRLSKRYQGYRSVVGIFDRYPVEELADQLDLPVAEVHEDLTMLISRGLLCDTYLVDTDREYILSRSAYEEFLEQDQKAREAGIPVEAKVERVEKANTPVDPRAAAAASSQPASTTSQKPPRQVAPEVAKLVAAGDAYVAQISAAKVDIDDPAISSKVDVIISIVERIYDYVGTHPETADDISMLNTYYLPTTVKLLDAYDKLEEQPVQGANITSSRQEISRTLDMLTEAYENLLDGLFRDMAWDVSADASVLQDVLKQQGLLRKQHRSSGNGSEVPQES